VARLDGERSAVSFAASLVHLAEQASAPAESAVSNSSRAGAGLVIAHCLASGSDRATPRPFPSAVLAERCRGVANLDPKTTHLVLVSVEAGRLSCVVSDL
jgi:hypothetical protein